MPWEAPRRRALSHRVVADAMGAPAGVLRSAAPGGVTKGKDAAGVARPYWGTRGTVEHGPGGVLAAEASRQGAALVDTRLCRPARWGPEA